MAKAVPDEQDSSGDKSNSHRAIARWTMAVAAFTFVLAVANIYAAYCINGQWAAAISIQNDTREQIKAYVTYEGGAQITRNKEGTSEGDNNIVFQPIPYRTDCNTGM